MRLSPVRMHRYLQTGHRHGAVSHPARSNSDHLCCVSLQMSDRPGWVGSPRRAMSEKFAPRLMAPKVF